MIVVRVYSEMLTYSICSQEPTIWRQTQSIVLSMPGYPEELTLTTENKSVRSVLIQIAPRALPCPLLLLEAKSNWGQP